MIDTAILTLSDHSNDIKVQFTKYGTKITSLIRKNDILLVSKLNIQDEPDIFMLATKKTAICRFHNLKPPYNKKCNILLEIVFITFTVLN